MKRIKFKTNLKCDGCISKVTPVLNNNSEIESWDVDLKSADKMLTVVGENINEATLVEAIEKTGFKLEKTADPKD